MKRLTEKDVDKYFKMYETYVGAKNDSLIDSFIFLVSKAYRQELKNDYLVNKELCSPSGNIALNAGWALLTLVNAALITTKQIDSAAPAMAETNQQFLRTNKRMLNNFEQ